MNEPKRLREWGPKTGQTSGRLFTCARPGWSPDGKQLDEISDVIVEDWVNGLPKSPDLVIVSLLGHKPKPDGRSEFSYYSFRSCAETSLEDSRRPTFQEWLNKKYGPGCYCVIECPTVDREQVPSDILTFLKDKILSLLGGGRMVVVMDSGGHSRSGEVRRHIGFCEDKNGLAMSRSAAARARGARSLLSKR